MCYAYDVCIDVLMCLCVLIIHLISPALLSQGLILACHIVARGLTGGILIGYLGLVHGCSIYPCSRFAVFDPHTTQGMVTVFYVTMIVIVEIVCINLRCVVYFPDMIWQHNVL